jgi:hypothetical protein
MNDLNFFGLFVFFLFINKDLFVINKIYFATIMTKEWLIRNLFYSLIFHFNQHILISFTQYS